MAVCGPSLAISVSFMEHDLLDTLLDDFEIDIDADDLRTGPRSPTSSASAVSPTSSVDSSVEPKRIRPDLDPLPLAENRTEYFTVNDYVWPTPKKRECYRMPDDVRRQRHRESQREFMTRKRAQFRAMRAEISHLENQLRWLKVRRELTTLTNEQHSLQAKLGAVVASIQGQVWKTTSLA